MSVELCKKAEKERRDSTLSIAEMLLRSSYYAALQRQARRVLSTTAAGGEYKGPEMRRYVRPLRTPQHGVDILHDPLYNKGTAFNEYERDRLGLRGLLPPAYRSLDQQARRVVAQMEKIKTDEGKNLYLQSLHNRNETLYFRTLVNNIAMCAPLVYTPTVGLVCQQFGSQFRRSRGMYFSFNDRGLMASMVHNWPHSDVHVIVVTDGSRILGLGDLGVNGMGIPIGKLALYCAAGGIAPHRVLPITLDVGTNNETLLQDENYLGVRERRLTGDEYFHLVDEFMAAVFARWPNVIVQFEDFETAKAVPLLARYKDKYRMFNDDIQGTGSVCLSGLLSALRNAGSTIKTARVLCAGGGSAGLGVCSQLVEGMVEAGMPIQDAREKFAICTNLGVLGRKDGQRGDPHYSQPGGMQSLHTPWVHSALSDGTSLVDAVRQFKPTVLLGLSTAHGIFNQAVIEAMNEVNPSQPPVIMPMSNPTSRAECTPEEAYRWTNGRAVVATGSPFAPVTLASGKVLVPSQCNNMYIFPGIGLAASVSGVTSITNKMLYAAAAACTNSMTEQEIAEGRTFPDIVRIREVSKRVALAVIEEGASPRTLTLTLTLRLHARWCP